LKEKIYNEDSMPAEIGERWMEKLKNFDNFKDEHGNVNCNLINQEIIYDGQNYIYTDQSSDSD
jgi:hypothetical protein